MIIQVRFEAWASARLSFWFVGFEAGILSSYLAFSGYMGGSKNSGPFGGAYKEDHSILVPFWAPVYENLHIRIPD